MRDVVISPSELGGTVKAIPSKSQAHRALICAALSEKPAIVECNGTSKDIEATIECLSALKKQPCVLNVGESGSTFRFLLAIVGALGLNAEFVLEGRLPERPLTPLYEELARHGCVLSPQGSNPLCISGQLTAGEYTLDGGVSSQFISGLLFALPLLDGDSLLKLSGKLESAPYVDLTVEMLARFGIKSKFENNAFFIRGNQSYNPPDSVVKVEGDWSNAAFWLCAGAFSQNGITCTGLNLQSKQGDRAVLDVLERFGANIIRGDDFVTVSKGELRGIEIDAGDIPDLVPVLSVVGVAASGLTTIRNAARLRIKESDRLAAVTDVLTVLGAKITEKDDGLEIHGGLKNMHKENGGNVRVSSWNDHRIAMSAAIAAAALCSQPVIIQGSEAVDKSYPTFFDDLRALSRKGQG
ncbi:MAG: 3-phosphoshikimate 1-carboxyvinyltransferase [Oscillospiraceae bacterium]|nr:3-phosphoshikimate 1-carboxyvinyltransferase [Oscillospiraceae bacterium]